MLIPAWLYTTVKNNLIQILRIHLMKKLVLYFYNRLGEEMGSCWMLLTILDHTQSITHTYKHTT